ncbi:RNA polymerase subunit sigma-70 [Caenimonas koreensis DSM 17982]|uniref:RNA polymerase subunit sigma-70 n=1 Tax=Caenimonas koreensis DSM 17982 TaxID=1121255 RepID=A0A844B8E0_9BURK|nr:anti-sigma factor [Caenimonas koreensis]MRD49422.1 RNA polymerase subunit sigma-70 [Caenimonas koreensis DSM 17982]
MNLNQHPELADRIAAAYALGTLRGGARRRFETMARQSSALRANALVWQERFAAMTELQRIEVPGENVWKRISNQLDLQRPLAAMPVQQGVAGRVLNWWRGAAMAGGMVAAAMMGVAVYLGGEVKERESQIAQLDNTRTTLAQQNIRLASELQGKPEIQYVAVLSDDKSSATMLVTFDPKHNTLTLKRVGAFDEGPEKSLQLWALPSSPTGAPRSLGVLSANPVIKLAAFQTQLKEAPALAITLEARGGVPEGSGPAGPVVFKGALLQTP